MRHLRRSPWQQFQHRRTQRVLDNHIADQKKTEMLAWKESSPPTLASAVWRRGRKVGGVTVPLGWTPRPCDVCPHLPLLSSFPCLVLITITSYWVTRLHTSFFLPSPQLFIHSTQRAPSQSQAMPLLCSKPSKTPFSKSRSLQW